MRENLRSPVRQYRTPGSARGTPGNRRSYLDSLRINGAIAERTVFWRSNFRRRVRVPGGGIDRKVAARISARFEVECPGLRQLARLRVEFGLHPRQYPAPGCL